MRLVLATLVMVAGMSACDRSDAPVVDRKTEDTTFRLEAEANSLATEIDALNKRLDEMAAHHPDPNNLAELDEYKQQLETLTAEKTALMKRVDSLEKAVAAQRANTGSN